MLLTSVKVGPFRSINEQQTIEIDPQVTVLVGMNEAGKTVFLRALHKAKDALDKEKFDITEDYPRKDLLAYKRLHQESPEDAVTLTYVIDDAEASEINAKIGCDIRAGFTFTVSRNYKNASSVGLVIPETPVLKNLAATAGLSEGAVTVLSKATSLRTALLDLKGISLKNEADTELVQGLEARVSGAHEGWASVCDYEAWQLLSLQTPSFLYFSDYDLLPGKLNLKDLANRLATASKDPANAHKQIEPKHQAVIALLRMAGVGLEEFSNGTPYEELKAQIESVSINLTDQILEFWRQNEDLEVEIDIRPDASDPAPFNDGPNLYLRIKNKRHRGVTTPFDQRSRGFIWFFSFLVWFDSVQQQLSVVGNKTSNNLVLLLDEPALALHALAQSDFLRYIDDLAETHQVIYTTHSPFMVNSGRLHQVRVVEDKPRQGTVISSNLSGSDSKTIFPLQAALGWNIAQNLFIAERNLLVEGVSELIVLQAMSRAVEETGGIGLDPQITIVPVGGLSNVATFVSLLGGNGLAFAVLHDYSGKSDQKLDAMVQQKLLNQKQVFDFSQFKNPGADEADAVATDLEDLLDPGVYLEHFNEVYSKALAGTPLKLEDLPQANRIVQRIEKQLINRKVSVRPTPGYNHFAVAAAYVAAPTNKISKDVTQRFSRLFAEINQALL